MRKKKNPVNSVILSKTLRSSAAGGATASVDSPAPPQFSPLTSGESGIVDLKDSIFRYPAAAEVRDPGKFREFYLDEWPTVAWKCGFDISPETLYELMTGRPFVWEACANTQAVAA